MYFSSTDMPAQANRHSLDFLYTRKKMYLLVYFVYGSEVEKSHSHGDILHCVCMGLFSAQTLGTPADTVMLAKASCVNLYFLSKFLEFKIQSSCPFPCFWLLMLCRRFGDGLVCLGVCYTLICNSLCRVKASERWRNPPSAFSWALGTHVTSHSLDKLAGLKTAHKTLWITLMQKFSSLFPRGVPITQLLDLKGNLVLRVQFTTAWTWMRGSVWEELGAEDNTQLVRVKWQGCPLTCILCRLPAPAPLTALTMSCSWRADLGQVQSNSHFCSRYIISLLWHRQDL